jgi:hypothetical protein
MKGDDCMSIIYVEDEGMLEELGKMDSKIEQIERGVEETRKVIEAYVNSIPKLVTHVATILSLNKEEYDEYVEVTNLFLEQAEVVLESMNAYYDKEDLLSVTLRHLVIDGALKMLDPYFISINDISLMIQERMDSQDIYNDHIIPLLDTIWARYGDEVVNFYYDNILEEATNSNPWIVAEKVGEAYMLHSFPSKVEAQMFVMQTKGLNRNDMFCRF